jgi:hypothetical protein
MSNNYNKKSLTYLAIREMPVKTTLKFHLTPVRMAIITKTRNFTEAIQK